MNAAFGAVSAGGSGTPLLDVTQSGGGPKAFVANQPGGRAGAVTPSKFSISKTALEQGPWHKGVGVGVAPAARLLIGAGASSSPEADSARVIAGDEPISFNAAMPAAINKVTQSILRNRVSGYQYFTVCILAAGVRQTFLHRQEMHCQFKGYWNVSSLHSERLTYAARRERKAYALVLGEIVGVKAPTPGNL